ncbi:MAG: DoxX family protein [Minicystis sp.]
MSQGVGVVGLYVRDQDGSGARALKASRGLVAGFSISTALFALQMGFTAYAQLRLPQVAESFAHLGFPAYFRVELSWAKLLGLAALLVPMVPARIKEWAYAGFAITLVSALIAHLAVGDGAQAWSWSVGTGVLWGLSYFFFRRREARAAANLIEPLTAHLPHRCSAWSPARSCRSCSRWSPPAGRSRRRRSAPWPGWC